MRARGFFSKSLAALLWVAVAATLALADPTSPNPNPNPNSLYARLGGDAAMSSLVDDYLTEVEADPEVRRSFAGVDSARLKAHVLSFLCAAAGGGCIYEGDDMKSVHAGLNITEGEMNRFVELLIESLDRHRVGVREKNELLAILAPMKRDIVTH
jgi:hemoglobin